MDQVPISPSLDEIDGRSGPFVVVPFLAVSSFPFSSLESQLYFRFLFGWRSVSSSSCCLCFLLLPLVFLSIFWKLSSVSSLVFFS